MCSVAGCNECKVYNVTVYFLLFSKHILYTLPKKETAEQIQVEAPTRGGVEALTPGHTAVVVGEGASTDRRLLLYTTHHTAGATKAPGMLRLCLWTSEAAGHSTSRAESLGTLIPDIIDPDDLLHFSVKILNK